MSRFIARNEGGQRALALWSNLDETWQPHEERILSAAITARTIGWPQPLVAAVSNRTLTHVARRSCGTAAFAIGAMRGRAPHVHLVMMTAVGPVRIYGADEITSDDAIELLRTAPEQTPTVDLYERLIEMAEQLMNLALEVKR